MIELALAFQDKDGRYTEHAGVMLASVFHHTDSPVHVHVLHDESLSEENKQKLVRLAAKYKNMIDFYPVAIPESMLQAIANIESINVWTQACMYRLLLPAILPVEKVIYLDCDVLVNLDLAELWQTDLGGAYLGAVWDQGIREVAHIVSAKGLNPDTYFNSGVICFSLNNIRCNPGWYDQTLSFLQNHPDTTMPDQDALNAVYGGNYLPLDIRFNAFNAGIPDHDYRNKIVHFAGDEKFWDSGSPGARLNHKYLILTPWRKAVSGWRGSKRRITHRKLRYKKARRVKLRIRRRRISRVSLTRVRLIKKARRRKIHLIRAKKRVRRPV